MARCRALDGRLLGWVRDEVEAVIVATQSPEFPYPGNTVLLQDRFGLPQSCMAFNINLGCSGYPYRLFVLSSMMSAEHIKKALLQA